MTLNRLLLRSAFVSKTLTRSAFTARKPDNTAPNWLRVGLALGSTAALWALLFKQHIMTPVSIIIFQDAFK
ncbi:NADH dehydrogenase [Huso huso]|uniref:NADH dehydrogenase [ubiquinone] 1 subunit C1, mitochondrial n=1 Tax=Huso huso TaxID=61971 RepID=A0ABR1A8V0_HUSHU